MIVAPAQMIGLTSVQQYVADAYRCRVFVARHMPASPSIYTEADRSRYNIEARCGAGRRVSTADARALAPDLRTTADFILSQPKLHFACHVRGMTRQAVSLAVPYGLLEREPTLSPAIYRDLQIINRRRVSLPPEAPVAEPSSAGAPAPAAPSDPDVADTSAVEWE